MSTRDDSLSVPWADSPASVSMPQPSSASTTPRGGDALGRAAMQVEQYQEAVNAAIAADDMDKVEVEVQHSQLTTVCARIRTNKHRQT